MADAEPMSPEAEEAETRRLRARFRDVVSDPLNLLIERAPDAGHVEDGLVRLHNGLLAPAEGPGAYYGEFSQILVINRGVHEPLEELLFQQVVRRLPRAPAMLELGAYWGHYSMWLKHLRPDAKVFMVEPKGRFLRAGRDNFALNGLEGEFIKAFVGKDQFEVDRFMEERGLNFLDILHADIQGFELEMLDGASKCLDRQAADCVFVSTHGDRLHRRVLERLRDHGYRVEVSSDLQETTAFDGLVFATSPRVEPLTRGFEPMGRSQIRASSPEALMSYLARATAALERSGGADA